MEGIQYIAEKLSDAQVASDPDWADCEFEEARAHTYHWHGGKGQWRVSHTSVMVCVQKTLFSEGALRNVYQMRQRDATTGMWTQMVAKSFKSACLGGAVTDIKQWHYREVESQVVAKHYADQFNLCNPPKRCDFIVPYCVEMVQRPGRPLYNVEVLFHGDKYEKHNTNAGGVTSDRNTPQAYTHFSFVASNKRMCVCDIQGVMDMYQPRTISS